MDSFAVQSVRKQKDGKLLSANKDCFILRNILQWKQIPLKNGLVRKTIGVEETINRYIQ